MPKRNRIIVQNLEAENVIIIKTENHEYRLKIINPKTGEVEVTSKDNIWFEKPKRMRVLYSVAPREIKNTKMRVVLPGIVKGYRLAMDKLLTSEIKKISLKNYKLKHKKD